MVKNLMTQNSIDSQISVDQVNTTNQVALFSVEQLNKKIRGIIETQFMDVWVKGEISNFKAHSSGHFYFSLKDSQSQIRAVMFKGHNSRLRFKPHDGLEVVIHGRVTLYEPRGEYQITCDSMEPVGAGALQKAFEQLKVKLKNEGLFDPSRKKPLPPLPRHIAIVTSPTGAAIQDMLNILRRRARGIEVTIVPCIVQGEAAAPALREAFIKASTLIPNIDVIIIGRGGGSIEDMWCFNDEELARLIAKSEVPVISAVGHEIDFTICDFVSDVRAPTPSAAAELVSKSADELTQKINSLYKMILISIDRTLKIYRQNLNNKSHRLIDPKRKIQDLILKNDDFYNRLTFAGQRFISRRKEILVLTSKRLISPEKLLQTKKTSLEVALFKLSSVLNKRMELNKSKLYQKMAVLDSLSPLKVVDRGYSIAQTEKGDVIKSVEQLKVNDSIQLRFASGKAKAIITELS